MILCFSGTGNSRYIAKKIAAELQDEIVDVNAKIKAVDYSPIKTGENVVVVTLTYAWRIPRIVSDWLSKTKLLSAKRIWFVMNCGSEIGNASKYNCSLAEPAIVDTIACIKTEQPFPVPRNNLYDRFMSGPVNPIFYQFFVKATAFQTGDTCIGCGQCVKNCPKNNIALENGKPRYHFEQLKIK